MTEGLFQRTKTGSLDKIPKWASHCTVDGCDEQTDVSILVVRDPNGRVRSGFASEFLMIEGGESLRPGYQFLRWVTRCARHYMQDYDRVKDRKRTTTRTIQIHEPASVATAKSAIKSMKEILGSRK